MRSHDRFGFTHHELRQSFLDYFRNLRHTIVKSSSLVPQDDPTLLFANAGMNQFKPYFLGQKVAPYPRAASVQKCLRASGKHNDLEEVGQDEWHHTFFEMLGNWSFGDYYKREAIEWAWRYITRELGLAEGRLWATVYDEDDEARGLWSEVTPLPHERVLSFGASENFWEMGETGPCGPCSEIHFDMGEEHGCGDPGCGPNCPRCNRYVEIWNLVFIQFDRDGQGKLHELPAKHVDTGMGLERTLAIVQGKASDYATDLFQPLIRCVEELSGRDFADQQNGVGMRAIADHIRALVLGISDGAMPSNEGRGYVLRRILRRAAFHGYTLGVEEPFLHKVAPRVVDIMGNAYREIRQRAEHVSLIVKAEEEAFGRTLERGVEYYRTMSARLHPGDILAGDIVFRLHATYGFPPDLTAYMARRDGLRIDWEGYGRALEQHRERSGSPSFVARRRGEAQKLDQAVDEYHNRAAAAPGGSQMLPAKEIFELFRDCAAPPDLIAFIAFPNGAKEAWDSHRKALDERLERSLVPESRSARSLDVGFTRYRRLTKDLSQGDALPPRGLARLVARYHFPPELVALLAVASGFHIDWGAYDEALDEERNKAPQGRSVVQLYLEPIIQPGFERLEVQTEVLGSRSVRWRGKKYQRVLLRETPFHADAGGALGDTGMLTTEGRSFPVVRTLRSGHFHTPVIDTGSEELVRRSKVRATVDEKWRASTFVGYETSSVDTEVLRVSNLWDGGAWRLHVLLKETPFYAEAGGQVGDTGTLQWDGGAAVVEKTFKDGDIVVHIVDVKGGRIAGGQRVLAIVDEARRRAIERHHTATHLLHAALREVLGTHVQQQGSHVGPDRFRFDFSHYQALSPDELRRVEEMVNQKVMEDLPVEANELAYQEALDRGALAFFGDKYGDEVRTMQIGDFSMELCGGTHLRRTGEVGFFAITRETSAAARVRRIEAVAGEAAYRWWRAQQGILEETASLLKSPPEDVATRVENLQAELGGLRKEVERLRRGEGVQVLDKILGDARDVAGARVAAGVVEAKDRNELRAMADVLRDRLGTGAGALGSASGKGCMLVTVVTADLSRPQRLNAGELASALAKELGGSGGGRPHLGEAGGKDCSKLRRALEGFAAMVEERLRS